MTVEENDIHILIAKYLSGEAESNEIHSLEEWRNQSSDNEIQFQRYMETWELIHAPSINSGIPDKEIIWNKLMNKIEQSAPVMYSRPFLYRIVGMAATLALLIGLSFSFLLSTDKVVEINEVIVKTQRGQKSEIILPDGSTVWLNGESSLTYTTDFQTSNREVHLTGEAFFDVVRGDKKFNVNTGEIQIQVHGTAFNVDAYKKNDIEVSLLRGHVKVHELESDRLLADLAPGYKASITNPQQLAVVTACDAEMESLWRHGILKIVDEPMAQLIEKLERWYGVNITLKGPNKGEHYWLTIKTESLTEILALIYKTTPINYAINGEEVIIEYK